MENLAPPKKLNYSGNWESAACSMFHPGFLLGLFFDSEDGGDERWSPWNGLRGITSAKGSRISDWPFPLTSASSAEVHRLVLGRRSSMLHYHSLFVNLQLFGTKYNSFDKL
jgi:hypothetical protein